MSMQQIHNLQRRIAFYVNHQESFACRSIETVEFCFHYFFNFLVQKRLDYYSTQPYNDKKKFRKKEYVKYPRIKRGKKKEKKQIEIYVS